MATNRNVYNLYLHVMGFNFLERVICNRHDVATSQSDAYGNNNTSSSGGGGNAIFIGCEKNPLPFELLDDYVHTICQISKDIFEIIGMSFV